MDTHVVILAAGKGTRMKSALPKVLHRIAGLPLIDYVLAGASALNARSTTVVLGHQADALRSALGGRQNVTFVVQEPQLGTAHALLQTEAALRGATGTLDECWDIAACLTYVLDPLSITPICSGMLPGLCPVQGNVQQCPTVP